MDELDLDKVRLKTVEELESKEIEFLNANLDKLTDEDKDAYATILKVEDKGDEGEDGDDKGSEGDDKGDDKGKGEEGDDKPKGFAFASEDEAKKYVADQIIEQQKKDRQAAIDAAKTPEEKKYVEENWKPKNWNEGIKVAVKAALDEVDERRKQETQKQEDQRKAFEKEWDGIVATNKLPKRETEDGKKILKAVFDIGTKYGQPNFTKAYDLYTKIPESEGGGLKVGNGGKGDMSEQKKRAAQVTGKTADDGKGKSAAPKSYQDLHGKSINQLIREGQRSLA